MSDMIFPPEISHILALNTELTEINEQLRKQNEQLRKQIQELKVINDILMKSNEAIKLSRDSLNNLPGQPSPGINHKSICDDLYPDNYVGM